MSNIKDKQIHVRVPEEILDKVKIICIEKKLSFPKMMTQLLKNFIDIDESNKKLMSHLKK